MFYFVLTANIYTQYQPEWLKPFLVFESLVFQLLLLNIFLFQVIFHGMTHFSGFIAQTT